MRKPKSTDTAAQMRKADADEQKREQGSTVVGDQTEATPTATELARDFPEIFGAETGKPTDRKSSQDRQPETNLATADQVHAAQNGGKPLNEPAKTEGQQIELGDTVILHTANPIGGQTANRAFVVGFNPINGQPNLRLELTDGSRAIAQDFGGVKQNAGDTVTDAYWTWPDHDQASKT